jgi:hypothetical protein
MVRQDFAALDGSVMAHRKFYHFGLMAAGLDIGYDGSIGIRTNPADVLWRAQPSERWALGGYGGYEPLVGRFGAFVHLGYKLAQGFDEPGAPRFISGLAGGIASTIASSARFSVRAVEDARRTRLKPEPDIGYAHSGGVAIIPFDHASGRRSRARGRARCGLG